MKRTIATVLVALMLLSAGCASGVDDGTTTPTDSEGTAAGGDDGGTATGTVNFYVSDEQNAIDQFQHLNVTITKVGFAKADDGEGETDAESDENGSASANASADADVEANATVDADVEANATVDADVEANATVDANATATADGTESDDADDVDGAESDDDGESDDGEPAEDGWTEYDVDSRTVDLTELQGANATSLGSLSAEEGSYTKVFVYVSEVEGTLKTGETVNVKLPSNKLQLNKGFALGSGESVDFVFDITVFEAGQSGKYILKPVVGESGTSDEVDIEVVDERPEKGQEGERSQKKGAETSLDASFVGDVAAGEDATVRVTENGSAVAGAAVEVDGEAVGTTDENGELTFAVPEGREELDVTVTAGDVEVELSQRLSASAGKGDGDGQSADLLAVTAL